MTEPSAPLSDRVCGNCRTALLGDFCYRCGQPQKGMIRHLVSLVSDFFDTVFNYDARVWRTLGPLLFRPGRLSIEYLEGRRVRYVTPFRLFFVLSLIGLLLAQVLIETALQDEAIGSPGIPSQLRGASTVEEVAQIRDTALAGAEAGRQAMADNLPGDVGRAQFEALQVNISAAADQRIAWIEARDLALAEGRAAPPEPGRGYIQFGSGVWDAERNPIRIESFPDWLNSALNQAAARMAANVARIQDDPRLLAQSILAKLPPVLFLLLPVFALLLKLFYLLKRRLYMEHLLVALHSHAFLMLAVIVLLLLNALQSALTPPSWLYSATGYAHIATLIWIPLYLLLMQKRVYAQGWPMTLLKYLLIGFCYLLLLLVAMVIVTLLGLLVL